MTRALAVSAVLLAGVAAGCSGSSGGSAAPAPTATTETSSPTPAPTVTMSAHPILTPTASTTTGPPAASGDVPSGATLVMRHDGSGTSYVVYAEPRAGSYCLVLSAGGRTGEQCVRAVPPANQLDVHTVQITGGNLAVLAGVTGARVAKVTVDTDDGSSLSVTPVALPGAQGKAFAAGVDPGTVSQVTAYDSSGAVVARS